MSRKDDFNLIDLTENLEKSTEELIREVKTESSSGSSRSRELNTDMYGSDRSRELNTDMYGSNQERSCNSYERRQSENRSADRYQNQERRYERQENPERKPYREQSNRNSRATGDEEMSKKRKGKKKASRAEKKLKRKVIKIAVVVAVLFGLVYGGVYAMVGKVDYETMETDYVRPSDVEKVSGVKNILLIGTDARSSDEDGRSDSMIVLSINTKKNRIVMTSILRDSYVEIPGHGSNRINAAYSYGQEDLLIQTIEQNFKIPIDAYVKVDFFSFIDIVDAVGGVEIDVSEEEKEWVNAYLNETNELLGKEFGDGYLTSAGVQTLSGKQALSYARIRYIGTDFQRTERQREIITAVVDKAKTAGPTAITKIMDSVMPNVKTNMKHSELTLFVMKAVTYVGYDMEQIHIPADGTWKNATISGMSVLQLDMDANIAAFKEAVYGDGATTAEE
jgi:LCP family protein required for cell wall assembly